MASSAWPWIVLLLVAALIALGFRAVESGRVEVEKELSPERKPESPDHHGHDRRK